MTPCTGEVADSPSGHGGFWGPVRSEYTDLNGHGLDGHGYLYPFCFTILETRIMYLHVFIIRKKDIINVISDFTFILSGKMTLFGTNRQVLQTSFFKFWAQSCCKLSHWKVPLSSNSNRSKTSFFWAEKKQKSPCRSSSRPTLENVQCWKWNSTALWKMWRNRSGRRKVFHLNSSSYGLLGSLVKTWWNIYPDFFGKKRVGYSFKVPTFTNLPNEKSAMKMWENVS